MRLFAGCGVRPESPGERSGPHLCGSRSSSVRAAVAPQVGEDLEEEPSLIWTECPGPPVPLLRSPGAAWLTALHQDGGAWGRLQPSCRNPQTLSGKLSPASCGRAGQAFTDVSEALGPRREHSSQVSRAGGLTPRG